MDRNIETIKMKAIPKIKEAIIKIKVDDSSNYYYKLFILSSTELVQVFLQDFTFRKILTQ